MMVLTSTSHISHKQLIVVCWRAASKMSMLLAIKTMHVVGDKDHGVDNSVENSDDSANNHLTHLSQGVDCCLTERRTQNKHIVGDEDNGVDNSVENGDDSANKHLTYFSQA
eukprot:11290893-Ditylum_brightwellii.AAC.1